MGKGVKKNRPAIKAGETKAERFTRVVTPRVNKAVKAIQVIGYCSSTTYEYTPEQVSQICNALNVAIDSIINRFSAKKQSQNDFNFGT